LNRRRSTAFFFFRFALMGRLSQRFNAQANGNLTATNSTPSPRTREALTSAEPTFAMPLRGRVSKVYVTCDREMEALFFSGQISTALHHAGIEIVTRPPRGGSVGSGVLIVLGASWSGPATEHPLVEAFTRAGLMIQGGVRTGFWPDDLPPDAPWLLIGEKPVEFGQMPFRVTCAATVFLCGPGRPRVERFAALAIDPQIADWNYLAARPNDRVYRDRLPVSDDRGKQPPSDAIGKQHSLSLPMRLRVSQHGENATPLGAQRPCNPHLSLPQTGTPAASFFWRFDLL
jgi:hypothetical protein